MPESVSQSPNHTEPKLLDRVRTALRVRHMARATEKSYVHWIRRFILFHGKRHPSELREKEVNAFLSHLATRGKVSASTQNQALSALLFLYRHVLEIELGDFGDLVRARRRRPLPVVLTREEVRAVLDQLSGTNHLIACLLYGSGLRLMECLRLRVKDVDFGYGQVLVRDGKGQKSRLTMLPSKLEPGLGRHLQRVASLHRRDIQQGHGRVFMPFALERKYPNASREWPWQYVFPSPTMYRDRETFGPLAATGMRMRETLHLDCEDVDLTRRLLTIRETKFRKSRYIPIHPTTQQALWEYRTHCGRIYRKPSTLSFFLSEKGHRLSGWSVRRTFIKLSHQIGLRGPSDSHGPRLHDLRHRFAVLTLLKWYRSGVSGVDVERQIPKLATYLGHAHFNDTYWYLTGVPELLQCAALRLEDPPQKGVWL